MKYNTYNIINDSLHFKPQMWLEKSVKNLIFNIIQALEITKKNYIPEKKYHYPKERYIGGEVANNLQAFIDALQNNILNIKKVSDKNFNTQYLLSHTKTLKYFKNLKPFIKNQDQEFFSLFLINLNNQKTANKQKVDETIKGLKHQIIQNNNIYYKKLNNTIKENYALFHDQGKRKNDEDAFSCLIIENIQENLEKINQISKKVSTEIIKVAEKRQILGGCTFIANFIYSNKIITLNIGDCRSFIIKINNQSQEITVEYLSEDINPLDIYNFSNHIWVHDLIKGRFLARAAYNLSCGGTLGDLGSDIMFRNSYSQANITTKELSLTENDNIFIFTTCDGIELKPQELIQITRDFCFSNNINKDLLQNPKILLKTLTEQLGNLNTKSYPYDNQTMISSILNKDIANANEDKIMVHLIADGHGDEGKIASKSIELFKDYLLNFYN